MQITNNGDNVTVYDYLTKFGKPNIACRIVLYSVDDAVNIAVTDTDKYGYYEFRLTETILKIGKYEIQKYGSGTVPKLAPDGDWESFDYLGNGVIGNLNDLVFDSSQAVPNLPVLTIEEKEAIADINNVEKSIIEVGITNIVLKRGRIAKIKVFYKSISATVYNILEEFIIDTSQATPSTLEVVTDIVLLNKPEYFDFKVQMFGVKSDVGKDLDNAEVNIYSLSKELDGIADVSEYYEVTDLRVTNAPDGESGGLSSPFANLAWTDYRSIARSLYPKNIKSGYDGTVISAGLSYDQSRRIESYVVFMYVSDTATDPPHPYPASDTGWYFMGEYTVAEAKIRCPNTKYVGFWVGFKMPKTVSSIPVRELNY